MAKSAIEICNVALSTLGQRSIFSFDSAEHGDNALLCKNIYTRGHRFVLSRVDWPFARAIAKLNKVSSPDTDLDTGLAIYSLPNLCVRPLRLRPPYDTAPWEILAEGIMTVDMGDDAESFPRLTFTKEITDPTRFSEAFTELLISYLVAKLAGPIAGLNPKEAAYYNSIFLGQLDSFPSGDLNSGQANQTENKDADVNPFSS